MHQDGGIMRGSRKFSQAGEAGGGGGGRGPNSQKGSDGKFLNMAKIIQG